MLEAYSRMTQGWETTVIGLEPIERVRRLVEHLLNQGGTIECTVEVEAGSMDIEYGFGLIIRRANGQGGWATFNFSATSYLLNAAAQIVLQYPFARPGQDDQTDCSILTEVADIASDYLLAHSAKDAQLHAGIVDKTRQVIEQWDEQHVHDAVANFHGRLAVERARIIVDHILCRYERSPQPFLVRAWQEDEDEYPDDVTAGVRCLNTGDTVCILLHLDCEPFGAAKEIAAQDAVHWYCSADTAAEIKERARRFIDDYDSEVADEET